MKTVNGVRYTHVLYELNPDYYMGKRLVYVGESFQDTSDMFWYIRKKLTYEHEQCNVRMDSIAYLSEIGCRDHKNYLEHQRGKRTAARVHKVKLKRLKT